MTPSKRPARRHDEDSEPSRASRSSHRHDDDDDDDDEPEEAPRRPRRSAGGKDGSQIKGGWTEGDRVKDSTSTWAQTLIVEEKSQVIKFLEDTPYANFRRHWIERTSKDSGTYRRPYTCPKTFGDDCPLCEVGDKPQAVSSFNVAVIGEDGLCILKSWDVGPRLYGVLKSYANDSKIGPLTKGFFLVNKSGGSGRRSGGTTQHNVSPVSRTAL